MTTFNPDEGRANVHASIRLFDKYVKGMSRVGQLMLSSAIQGGVCHFLGQGNPGGGKTRSVDVMAAIIGGRSHVEQGTPDKLPKDIMGSEWLDKADGKWKVTWGKMVDAQIVMGDEFNRFDTRTQSVFMSPMSEGRCTVSAPHLPAEEGVRMMHPVRVFLCVQNDVGSEGTNPLPPAQYDRFLYMVNFNRIAREFEKALLMEPSLGDREVLDRIVQERVLSLDHILDIRRWVQENMRISERFVDYQLSVVRATEPGSKEFIELWTKYPAIRPILDQIKSGVSVRGNLALLRACQVRAYLFGKDKDGVTPRRFLMPEDLRDLAHDVMDHRMVMHDRAATRVVQGKVVEEERWSHIYPSDGTITREQVVHRLNRPGRNPILPSHVTDAILTHLDHTNDWSQYASV
jgi:MoxR-like ATPase